MKIKTMSLCCFFTIFTVMVLGVNFLASAGSTNLTKDGIVFPDGTSQTTAATSCINYAPLAKTGQNACYDNLGAVINCSGSGLDGEYQMGIGWPTPRFTDHGNGTVTDNLTHLMWTKNANLSGGEVNSIQDALTYVNNMNAGVNENFGHTDWRVPNMKQLFSLIDCSQYGPPLPSGHPFDNVVSGASTYLYWTSTSYTGNLTHTWCLSMYGGGSFGFCNKGGDSQVMYLWPVRGGQ
jgi:hypothetical protein